MRGEPLSRFEAAAQRLVEGSFKRLFGGQLEPFEIAASLARALEDYQLDDQAPGYFQVRLNERDYQRLLRHHPRMAEELAAYVTSLAQQTGLKLAMTPEVLLIVDSTLGNQEVEVAAEHDRQRALTSTKIHPREREDAATNAAIRALDAYLIIDGQRHVSLDRPLITVGRRVDNDIVLDATAVSRRHAQLRWRYGRFLLYDLSRRGRTAVNGQPVSEYVLQPGDVISLSGTMLIYGEGQGEERSSRSAGDDDAPTRRMPTRRMPTRGKPPQE